MVLKNQGFLDSLLKLSNMDREHYIFTNHNNYITGIKIKLNKLKQNYLKQSENNTIINYDECQQIINKNITIMNDQEIASSIINTLDNVDEIKNLIENYGTYIMIQTPSLILKDFDLNYFQYMYTNRQFMLYYNNKELHINSNIYICRTDKYIPVKFYLYMNNIDNSKYHIMKNNFTENIVCYCNNKDFPIEKYNKIKDKGSEILIIEAILKFLTMMLNIRKIYYVQA